jgi:hypothetical protein
MRLADVAAVRGLLGAIARTRAASWEARRPAAAHPCYFEGK